MCLVGVVNSMLSVLWEIYKERIERWTLFILLVILGILW